MTDLLEDLNLIVSVILLGFGAALVPYSAVRFYRSRFFGAPPRRRELDGGQPYAYLPTSGGVFTGTDYSRTPAASGTLTFWSAQMYDAQGFPAGDALSGHVAVREEVPALPAGSRKLTMLPDEGGPDA